MSVEFQKVNGVTRSVYPQLGGGVILADECKCRMEWGKIKPEGGVSFRVTAALDCPVDKHAQKARMLDVS